MGVVGSGLELHYRDPEAALTWLKQAFGLEAELLVHGADGALVFARVEGPVGIVPAGPGRPGPAAPGGRGTATVTIALSDDVEGHCARARAAGARITVEPRREFYGDLDYVAADLEGHLWCFSQKVAEPDPPPDGWRVEFPKGSPGRGGRTGAAA